MVAVALQNGFEGRGVFHGDERRIGAFLCADKENERFFAHYSLVVIHSSYAVVQCITFRDEVCRGTCDNCHERTSLVMLESGVFFRDCFKTRIKFFALVFACDCHCGAVFVYADIVPASEFVGEKIAFEGHIESQINAGLHIVRIGAGIGFLCCEVFAKVFEISVFEKLFDGGIIFRALKALFYFVITL